MSLPKGPPVAALQSLRYAKDPYGFFESCRRTYGDPFTIKNLSGTIVMTGDPDAVRAIFTADPDTYGVFLEEALQPLLGGESLFLLTGAPHKSARKLLAPPFHGARMRAYGAIARDVTARFTEQWPRDRPFVMQETTQAISLDVIIRAVFGIVDERRGDDFRAAIHARVAASNPAIIFLKALRHGFGGLGPWAKFQRAMKEMDALIYREIVERRSNPTPKEDILSMLLAARYEDGGAMEDRQIRDQLLTLLVAGHETTASALAWAFYWIHQEPRVLARLKEELASLGPSPQPEAISALPYLDAVCNETLRLHPIVPDVVRKLKKPLRLKGYDLPPGVGVGVCTNLVHTRGDVFGEPGAFVPERFVDRAYSPYEFLPFGGGSRRCVGAAFATYEMKIVLATILERYALRLCPSSARVKPTRRNFTMGPAGGVDMLVESVRAA